MVRGNATLVAAFPSIPTLRPIKKLIYDIIQGADQHGYDAGNGKAG